jgi:hypothetical protein
VIPASQQFDVAVTFGNGGTTAACWFPLAPRVRRGGTAYALIDELRRSGPGLLLNQLSLIGSHTRGATSRACRHETTDPRQFETRLTAVISAWRDVLRRVAGS